MKITIPAFRAMAKCNEHLNHGPIDIDLGPDVVLVVHCKDCRNSYEGIDGRICSFGPCVDCVVPDDFFCSFGERRAENASKEM